MTRRKQTAVGKKGYREVRALNKVVFDLLEERAERIADALMKATRDGHSMSTRLLVELAAKSQDPEQEAALRPFRKLLLDLAAEAQLPAEALDAAEETEA